MGWAYLFCGTWYSYLLPYLFLERPFSFLKQQQNSMCVFLSFFLVFVSVLCGQTFGCQSLSVCFWVMEGKRMLTIFLLHLVSPSLMPLLSSLLFCFTYKPILYPYSTLLNNWHLKISTSFTPVMVKGPNWNVMRQGDCQVSETQQRCLASTLNKEINNGIPYRVL